MNRIPDNIRILLSLMVSVVGVCLALLEHIHLSTYTFILFAFMMPSDKKKVEDKISDSDKIWVIAPIAVLLILVVPAALKNKQPEIYEMLTIDINHVYFLSAIWVIYCGLCIYKYFGHISKIPNKSKQSERF